MPTPAVWGPLAWALLHAIGARTGHTSSPKLRADEQREALWLLAHLETIIPCAECRQHIQIYRKRTGLPSTSSDIAQWLWTFHETVNIRLGKSPGPPFTPDLGKTTQCLLAWKTYLDAVKESFTIGHLAQVDVKEWGRHFRMWLACL
jgi:hypothetical protein